MTDRTTAPRPRVIERWFPCAEVSAASSGGWGSSNGEAGLMTWFAKRPLAQSRAAVLCSLLPWPESADEQERVKGVIRESLNECQDKEWKPGLDRPHAYGIVNCARHDGSGGYNAARADVLSLLRDHYPHGAEVLDPFAGRGLIPIEAARFGLSAHAIDYSPVATMASHLLIDYPFRNWTAVTDLPFDHYDNTPWRLGKVSRLVHDIEIVNAEIGRRWKEMASHLYPDNAEGSKPWGYLWAAQIPCNECGRTFPLYGSNVLQKPGESLGGQSFEITAEGDAWSVRVRPGITDQPPTMKALPGQRGKLAWCPFLNCRHAHQLEEHKALVRTNFDEDVLLIVADWLSGERMWRTPTEAERHAADAAKVELRAMDSLNGLTARPNERIFPGSSLMRANLYGAETFGDLLLDRQNLSYVYLARAIADVVQQIAHESPEYSKALGGYAGAAFIRKLRRSGRGCSLMTYTDGRISGASDIFRNESTIGYNYDCFETGLGPGPGSWESAARVAPVLNLLTETDGSQAGHVLRGSALALPFADNSLDALVTDPPYDAMINYTDASDLFFVWLKRALGDVDPNFAMTAHQWGTQENAEEIIASHFWNLDTPVKDHRTPAWYDVKIKEAFVEHARVVHDDGVVTIVFGHNEPDVWRRLLGAISDAGLVLTGAWPANTEKGGQAGSANINTTLTLACRPAPTNRPDGDVSQVDAEVRSLVKQRVREVWTPSQLSYVDQKMAAVGPALEVVGHYARVLDNRGLEVELARYLPLARQAVTDAWDMRFDGNPLEVFDRRTQFALEWVRATGRAVSAASEARWQRLAADMEDDETEGLLADSKKPKGVRFTYASEWDRSIDTDAPFVDVALGAAKAWHNGSLADAAAVIRASGYEPLEPRLWAVIGGLSKDLPDADTDGAVWAEMLRNKSGIVGAVHSAEAAEKAAAAEAAKPKHTTGSLFQTPGTAGYGVLFEDPNSLFGREGS